MDPGSLTTSRRFFGTDGVRGRVGEVLDPELAVALGRAAEAGGPAEELLALVPGDVEALVAVAMARAAQGDAAAALTALQQAQNRAPARADLRKLQGDVLVKVGDRGGALAAYRAALELDQGFVAVWVDLGRLHEQREEWADGQRAYERALEVLPTYHEATLALADLQRRQGRLRPSGSRGGRGGRRAPPPAAKAWRDLRNDAVERAAWAFLPTKGGFETGCWQTWVCGE